MADTTSIKCVTFKDIWSIAANRARVASAIQERDLNFLKGVINEYNISITTERNWQWRKFDRTITFSEPVSTGTVSVTSGSREIIFSTLTLSENFRGRTFKIDGQDELYRIIGIDASGANDKAYLDNNIVSATSATATFKIYQYEFPIPPDFDVSLSQVYIDSSAAGDGELEYRSSIEFNRMLSSGSSVIGTPAYYTIDGKIGADAFPPLDIMLLDYDFLAGDSSQSLSRLRVFPIAPERTRLIHLNGAISAPDLVEDGHEPLMPRDDRWVLVHFAVAEWHSKNGNPTLAASEFAKANKKLKEMRSEHVKTDSKPRLKVDARGNSRRHFSRRERNRDILWNSRQSEY